MLKLFPYRVHQVLRIFLRRPGHLSLLKDPGVRSQEVLEDLCLQEYRGHLVHQAVHVLLSLAEIPVDQLFIKNGL